MLAREHTAQVDSSDREEREQAFREGTLPALFCSPTMELGIDIQRPHGGPHAQRPADTSELCTAQRASGSGRHTGADHDLCRAGQRA